MAHFFNDIARAPRPDKAQTLCMNDAMYRALKANDQHALEDALLAGAQPDADEGKPLRLCAQENKYLLAKTLLLAGGDLGYALQQARQENEAIPRRTESGMILSFRTPITEDGKKREIALGREIARLEEFQKTFTENTLPMEQMNLLRDIRQAQFDLARRMDAVEKALREIDTPKPLDKKSKQAPRGGLHRKP